MNHTGRKAVEALYDCRKLAGTMMKLYASKI